MAQKALVEGHVGLGDVHAARHRLGQEQGPRPGARIIGDVAAAQAERAGDCLDRPGHVMELNVEEDELAKRRPELVASV